MKLNDIKISWQLFAAFSTMMLFFILLGVVSVRHGSLLNEQTVLIYNHPLKVQKAIGELKLNVVRIQLTMRNLLLTTDEEEFQRLAQFVQVRDENVLTQFEILKLHDPEHAIEISETYDSYIDWIIGCKVQIPLINRGQNKLIFQKLQNAGSLGKLKDIYFQKINVLEKYSSDKSAFLYNKSLDLNKSLQRQMIGYIIFNVLVLLVIIALLIRNFRVPILELGNVSNRFQAGDLSARSSIQNNNEFGQLSKSFNSMMESIQKNMELSQRISRLSDLMMSEELARSFFKKILPALLEETNSQMAAVYFLSDDKKHFEHYESIGMADELRLSFGVDNFQGEFGPVLATRTIQFIKRIPINTQFVFQTVSGKFIPREIVTIPILTGSEVIAVISLASVRTYSDDASLLITSILDTLNARVQGVITYRKMRKFSEILEEQNFELESQKMELGSQSKELIDQNIELEMQKNQLTEVSRLKTNFLSNMSHELRTPLNSVIALSGVLNRRLSKKIPDDEYSYIEVIERNGKYLLSLINDILDISRIEAGREEVEIDDFIVNEVVADVIAMIIPQAKQKKIKLIQTDIDKNIVASGDSAKYKHILQNLIGNAVKFTDKGKVEVSLNSMDDKVCIRVADTGIGINSKELDNIFDEFRQADGSTSRRHGGTGLGLAIAKKYANLLGGTISVESDLGIGSCFTLIFPLKYQAKNRIYDVRVSALPQVDSILQSNLATPNEQNGQKTILLVEDSEPAIIQIKDFLEESGYKILTANNGSDALKIIEQIIPDAMLLDLMMPGVDGFDVLKSLRAVDKTAHIPVIVLTAKHITKDDLQELKRNNVHQLIQKGDINRTDLLDLIAKMTQSVVPVKIELPKSENRVVKGTPSVLIVEDNIDNLLTIKAILGNEYTILEAKDGPEGIELANRYVPNLILMDILLPGLDGIRAFKEIRQTDSLSHIPIIAITASAMPNDRETILAHGFDGYLLKPIDETEFFDTINQVLFC